MPSTKIRLRFAKRGDLRLISHHDLLRCLERALRRAGLPVARTQGFTPRPKVAFAQALALGVEGRREVLEIELDESIDPSEARRRLAATLPAGFDLLEAATAPPGRPARAVAADYRLAVPEPLRPGLRAALERFLAAPRWPMTRVRGDRRVEVDLRPLVLDARLDDDGVLRFRLAIDPAGSARPSEWLEALGQPDLAASGGPLIRDDLLLADEAAAPAGIPFPSRTAASDHDDDDPAPNPEPLTPDEAELTCPPT